jgi:uncharacterized membrane protein YkvA (DUF1232 family)
VSLFARLKGWARRLKRDVVALWLGARDPRVPWLAKALAALVAAYALSPIDLIPDVIPVLGILDELVLLPLGIALAVRLIPPDIMADLRRQAEAMAARPVSRAGTAAILLLWTAAAALLLLLIWRWSRPG